VGGWSVGWSALRSVFALALASVLALASPFAPLPAIRIPHRSLLTLVEGHSTPACIGPILGWPTFVAPTVHGAGIPKLGSLHVFGTNLLVRIGRTTEPAGRRPFAAAHSLAACYIGAAPPLAGAVRAAVRPAVVKLRPRFLLRSRPELWTSHAVVGRKSLGVPHSLMRAAVSTALYTALVGHRLRPLTPFGATTFAILPTTASCIPVVTVGTILSIVTFVAAATARRTPVTNFITTVVTAVVTAGAILKAATMPTCWPLATLSGFRAAVLLGAVAGARFILRPLALRHGFVTPRPAVASAVIEGLSETCMPHQHCAGQRT